MIRCLKGVATIHITFEKNCALVDYFSIDVVSHFAFDVAICFTLLLIMDLLWRPSHLIKQLLYQGCYFVSVWMWAWTSEPKKIFLGISCWHWWNIIWHIRQNIWWHGRIFCHVSWMNYFLEWKRMINKMDELSNECWQQIKLHFPPLLLIFLIHTWSCIYSTLTT